MFSLGLSVGEVAERRGLAESTIVGHLEGLVEAGEELDLEHLMPPAERFGTIKAAFQDSGGLRAWRRSERSSARNTHTESSGWRGFFCWTVAVSRVDG